MRLDFHTHGKLAKKLPFSTAYTDWLFGEARRAGLDALCLTEHFNTLQFADVYGYIASVSRRIGDTLELEKQDCLVPFSAEKGTGKNELLSAISQRLGV